VGQDIGLGAELAGRIQPRQATIGAIQSPRLTNRDRGQPLKRLAPLGLAAQESQPGKRARVVDVARSGAHVPRDAAAQRRMVSSE